MKAVQDRPLFKVALVVRPPLAGVVALALTHIRAVPLDMQITDVRMAGCDFAVLDEAVADGGLRGAIAEMTKFLQEHKLDSSPITTSDGRLVGLLLKKDLIAQAGASS